MLQERRLDILSALVDEYVASAHPVSSRTLVERYGLQCSPATVRNDLVALEEAGLLFQPHVSAGRIPTDNGYRVYVDQYGPFMPSLAAEVAADIRRRLAAPEREVDELVRHACSVLAGSTQYAAVVVAPAARRARIRRLSLVPMGPRDVLVVVVTDLGQVLKRMVELAEQVDEREVAEVQAYLDRAVTDRLPGEVAAARHELLRDPTPFRRLAVFLLDAASACLDESDARLVAHGGLGRLLTLPEFSDPRTAAPLVSLLEDAHAALARLAEMSEPGHTFVRIGHENDVELASLSIVATAWGQSRRTGLVCLIGPTRMQYPRAMAMTSCVAESLSEVL
jgi:heat-inducible transcriptional repressor